MEVKEIPQVALNSGQKMPVIGFGTASMPLPPHEALTSIFIDAFEVGYRHFDTAAIYGSEEPLGKAVAKALELGLIKSRDEVFITSKLWANNGHHDLALPALKTTLQKLGLEYVDLYLIHWPVRLKPEAEGIINITKEDVIPFDIKGTWEAMEECYRLGLAKSIGVSNFGIKKLNQLLENATIPPAVNQIALRWIYEEGASAIVKSFNKERMKINLEIFDWELSQEESRKFSQIPQHRMYPGEIFVSENGPYRSLEELWDGDP